MLLWTSLHYADTLDCFVSFFSFPHSEAHVWYNLVDSLCTIQSGSSFRSLLYNINLRAMHTTILSIRGVTIPIYLVSSATDSIRSRVVLFKTVTIPTSDPKSEFLCQLSSSCAEPTDSPEPPRMPGISPTPLSPRIILIATVQVLSLSTWRTSSVCSELSDLVVAYQLKSSRLFNLNITRYHSSNESRRSCTQNDSFQQLMNEELVSTQRSNCSKNSLSHTIGSA